MGLAATLLLTLALLAAPGSGPGSELSGSACLPPTAVPSFDVTAASISRGLPAAGDASAPDPWCLNRHGKLYLERCASDAECCSNFCAGCQCEGWVKIGDRCRTAADCDFGRPCTGGVCVCSDVGAPCRSPFECCSGSCKNDVCTTGGIQAPGAPCSENRWCTGALCKDARCASKSCDGCWPNGYLECRSGAACCSGICDVDRHCTCLENGRECREDRNCCGLACRGGRCEAGAKPGPSGAAPARGGREP